MHLTQTHGSPPPSFFGEGLGLSNFLFSHSHSLSVFFFFFFYFLSLGSQNKIPARGRFQHTHNPLKIQVQHHENAAFYAIYLFISASLRNRYSISIRMSLFFSFPPAGLFMP